MLISELPPELQQLCHQRQREQGNDGTFTGDVLEGRGTGNFNWDETPEEDFWEVLWGDGLEYAKLHKNYPKHIYEIY